MQEDYAKVTMENSRREGEIPIFCRSSIIYYSTGKLKVKISDVFQAI